MSQAHQFWGKCHTLDSCSFAALLQVACSNLEPDKREDVGNMEIIFKRDTRTYIDTIS